MRIGILTQPFLRNYGGILQNWALQQVLLKLGHEPLTFEHDTCYTRIRWLLRTIKQIGTKGSFAHLPAYPYKGRVGHKPFIDFIEKQIHSVPTRKFSSDTEKRYACDAFIVGSDQVWRPDFNIGRLHNMYLDFASDNVKKIVYAASFGVSDWEYSETETSHCSRLAKRLDAISVREDPAITLCREYLKANATLALDPTMVLNKEDYTALCENVPKREGMLFVYALHLNNQMIDYANKLSEEYGLKTQVLEAGDNLHSDDSIEQWLASFRDAACVVTDSYHGAAFSIIFNKPFHVFKNEGGGTARYESLLKQFNLSSRIVENGRASLPTAIDWNMVNSRHDELKSVSIQFLYNSLA